MAVRISGLVSGLDTDSIVQELVSSYNTQKEDLEKAQTKLEWKQEAWKEMNSKIYGFYSKTLTEFKFMSDFSGFKKTTVSDSSKATVTAGTNVANGTQTLKVNKLATAAYLTGSEVSSVDGKDLSKSSKLSELGITGTQSITLNIGDEAKEIELTEDMTIAQLTDKLKEAGVDANFDTNQQRFFINAKESGADYDFGFDMTDDADFNTLRSLGLVTGEDMLARATTEEEKAEINKNIKNYAVKQEGSDAEIELNGAVFTGSSNTFEINGLTVTARGVTDTAMTISTETDVDAVYDKIKNFLNEYNELVNAMDSAYNAASSKGYEPLTDDEKEEMGETAAEKWEKKIKDSLLRRDSTLDSVASVMKSAMAQSFEIDGKSYSLSTFGIKTLGYFVAADNEKGAYHIDGNADDEATSMNADKLKSAIASDPDSVATFFNKLANNLYSKLDAKMKSTTLSSAYKVYNDKQMQSEYDDYTEKIQKWEDKVADMEDYYYNKFSAMEQAMSELNSQQSQLSGLLGM